MNGNRDVSQSPSATRAGLLFLEGTFCYSENDWRVFPGGHSVAEALAGAERQPVTLEMNHLPPQPPLPRAPGFGSCQWPEGQCPAGHAEDPAWCLRASLEGVLTRTPSGSWEVGGSPLPLRDMSGHRGRLVVFSTPTRTGDPSVGELLREAQDLISTLEALKGHLRESS